MHFAGTACLAGGIRVSITGENLAHNTTSPTPATCGYQLESDGDVAAKDDGTGGVYSDIGDWITPKVGASGYEARATETSGTLSSGTTGSWLALSSTRTWTVERTTVGSKACTFTLEIRRASDGTVLTTASITLTATMDT